MNIHHVVFVCVLSAALCGGNTGLVSAKVNIYTGAEGGRGSINCHFTLTGKTKFFCRDECKAEDVLIRTDDVTAQDGRYSIEYRNESSTRGILSVTITNLTKSDSGRYRCGLGKALVPASYSDFEIRVSDAALLDGISYFVHSDIEGENITFPCSYTVYGKQKFLCRGECKTYEEILIETDGNKTQSGRYSIKYEEGSLFGLYVTIRQVTKSDTGRYKCGYGKPSSPDSFRNIPVIVIEDPSATTPTPTQTSNSGDFPPSSVLPEDSIQLTASSHDSHPGYFLPLVVCVSLVAVLLLAVFLLLLYIWKTRRNFTPNSRDMFPVIYRELAPASTCEDSAYETSRD